jgi:hypothetical protein
VADVLLALQQGGVFVRNALQSCRAKKPSQSSNCSRIAAEGAAALGEFNMQQGLPGELIQRRRFQVVARSRKSASSPPGLALFSQWHRNANASADESGSASRANNRCRRWPPPVDNCCRQCPSAAQALLRDRIPAVSHQRKPAPALSALPDFAARQAQRHLSGDKSADGNPSAPAETLVAHQAVAVAGMKAAQRMRFGKARRTAPVAVGPWVLRPGDKLGVQHFAFALLIVRIHTRVSEHV